MENQASDSGRIELPLPDDFQKCPKCKSAPVLVALRFDGDRFDPVPKVYGYKVECPECGYSSAAIRQQRKWTGDLDKIRDEAVADWGYFAEIGLRSTGML